MAAVALHPGSPHECAPSNPANGVVASVPGPSPNVYEVHFSAASGRIWTSSQGTPGSPMILEYVPVEPSASHAQRIPPAAVDAKSYGVG